MAIATVPHTTLDFLIEEARERHRRRLRRRAAAIAAIAALVGLAFGIGQVVRGGSSVAAKLPAAAVVEPSSTVTYEKVETLRIAPGLPVQRRTSEIWSAANAPATYRELTRVGAGPAVEVGAGPGYDKTFGAEQVVYLYRGSSDSIYRAGAVLAPSSTGAATTPAGFFHRLRAQPRVRLAGTRMLDGHRVYVVRLNDANATMVYVDTRTFTPVMTVFTDGTAKIVQRTLAHKSLPATQANLALTRLAAAHPGARVRPAPPAVRELYARVRSGLLPLSEPGWRAFVLSKTGS
jgi:hypothetical protein